DQRAGQKVENEYWNLFPAASITFTANENNRLSVAYTRRLDRPAYQRLNPFITLLDDITFWQGNAFLRPQYANRFSLDYSHGSGTVFSLAYSRTTDMMAQVDDTLDVNKVVMTPRNVGRQNHFSLNVTRTIKFTNWWEASASGLLYYVDNLIVFDAKRRFELDATAYNLNLQQTFRIPRDFTFELTGNYNSSTVTSGNRRSRANGAVNVGLRKKLSEKSTLSLAMTDVFLTSRWNNISAFNGFYYRSFGHGESRQVRLNFTYTFGQKKIQAPKKRDSALDTENNRLN
ncbi:MAG: outer membrane beta-barrel family protein, partial [Rufibacter sp.]